MLDEWSELKRLAEAATPGPWQVCVSYEQPYVLFDQTRTLSLGRQDSSLLDSSNAAYIAAVNPAVILRLLERAEKAESEVQRLTATPGFGFEREGEQQ